MSTWSYQRVSDLLATTKFTFIWFATDGNEAGSTPDAKGMELDFDYHVFMELVFYLLNQLYIHLFPKSSYMFTP